MARLSGTSLDLELHFDPAEPSDGSRERLIRLVGRLEQATQVDAEKAFREAVAAGGRFVILDCAKLEFISSAGIRAFIVLIKLLKPLDGRAAVCAPQPHVRQALEFSGLKSLLSISSSIDEVRATLSRSGSRLTP
jgi:anti-anti-sigma factor